MLAVKVFSRMKREKREKRKRREQSQEKTRERLVLSVEGARRQRV
jgi:hypothetical protein